MEQGVVLLTIAAYSLAGYLWWRDDTPHYLIALLAGHVGTLLSPLWQALYSFSYDPRFEAMYVLLGRPLPGLIFVSGWFTLLPALVIFYLFRHRWWFPGYVTSLLTFGLFVFYHVLFEAIGVRQGWWHYVAQPPLPFRVSVTVLAGLMNGLVSFGLLSALLLTRRYPWTTLLLILLPMVLALKLFVHGLLGAPLYTTVLLSRSEIAPPSWAGAIGMVGTLGLLLWGVHIVAGSLDQQRTWRQTI